jgi:hypothetical protein
VSAPRAIARIIALLLLVLFVTLLPIVLLTFSATDVALSPGFLTTAVSDTRLYRGALAEAAAGLARDLPTRADTRNLPIARVDAQGWQQILTVVAPPASVQRWVEGVVQGFRTWRWGDTSLLNDVVPFGDLRNNLFSDPAQTALRVVTEAQPPCASGQDPLASPTDLIPRCRPAADGLQRFYDTLWARWQAQPQAVWQQLWPRGTFTYSDNITLGELIQRENGQSWRNVGIAWRWAGWSLGLARLFLILAMVGAVVVTLAIIAALAARNWAEVLRWVGGPLLLAGFFTFAWGLVLLAGGWIGPHWSDVTGVTPDMQAALRDLARLFTNRTFVALAWQGALLMVVGLALWGSSFLLRKPRPQE